MSKRRKIPEALTGVHLRTSTLPDAGVSGYENHRLIRHNKQFLFRWKSCSLCQIVCCSVTLSSIRLDAYKELDWNPSHQHKNHLVTSTHLRLKITLLANAFITSELTILNSITEHFICDVFAVYFDIVNWIWCSASSFCTRAELHHQHLFWISLTFHRALISCNQLFWDSVFWFFSIVLHSILHLMNLEVSSSELELELTAFCLSVCLSVSYSVRINILLRAFWSAIHSSSILTLR